MKLNSIQELISDVSEGKMVILMDDEGRENEGDLILAAQKVTAEAINFMATHARGLICLALNQERCDQLNLEPMVKNNGSQQRTAFTVSIEAAKGVTTGISAADRATTILAAVKKSASPKDIIQPGHVFPLRAADGGVLTRAGHTEAAVDLAKMANMLPAGVICEIMNEDGTMARVPDLKKFADHHGIKIITIKDLIQYRKRNETLVVKKAEASLPSIYGDFQVIGFQSLLDDSDYVALVKGKWDEEEPVLVRVHSECLTGDVFGSYRCDCGPQLHAAMELVEKAGKGVILYLPQEGRGIGLINKLQAYRLQEDGADTVEANHKLGFKDDLRDYGMGAQMLYMLGVRRMRLMTNNPRKIVGVQGHGLEVVERVPLEIESNPGNKKYMHTKKSKLGHMLKV